MINTYDLVFKVGADFPRTFTYAVNGVPTQVDGIAAEVKTADQNGTLVLDLADFMTQVDPGVMVLIVPAASVPNTPAETYVWDMFGTVGGIRKKLIDTSNVTILAAVSV